MSENERFTFSDVWGWRIDGFLNVMNGLDRKNNELKKRIKELDRIWKKAYADAKSKVRSGIRTKPTSDEILLEMVKLLKEKDIYPLKIWNYDVDNKKMKEEDSL